MRGYWVEESFHGRSFMKGNPIKWKMSSGSGGNRGRGRQTDDAGLRQRILRRQDTARMQSGAQC